MLRLPAAAWLVFVVTTLLYHNAVLNHFYAYGSGTDPFWFAGVMWHGDLALHGPPGIDERSFFTVHLSPLLMLPALLSHVLPFDLQQWLALVLGVMHGFTSAALTWCVCKAFGQDQNWKTQAMAIAVGAAYAGCALQAEFMGLPHYEIVIPGLMIAFMAALALRRQVAAIVFFVLALSAREDVGLHVFAFLATLVTLVRWRDGYWLQPELRFGIAALVASLLLMVVVPQFIPEHQSLFHEHYVGDPPFAQLTWQNVQTRLQFFALQSGHIWGPPLALLVAAILRRDPLTAVGGLAVLPWIALHTLFGIHLTVWTMGFYYAFPVLAAMAWPSLLRLYRTKPAMVESNDRGWLWLQLVVVLLASLPMFGKDLPMYGSRYAFFSFSSPSSLARLEAYEQFQQLLPTGRPALGNVVANLAAVALDPFTLKRSEWLEALPVEDANALAKIDTILLFAAPYSCPGIDQLLARLRLPFAWEVPGTRIKLFTRKTPEELATFSQVLVRSASRENHCGDPLTAVRK